MMARFFSPPPSSSTAIFIIVDVAEFDAGLTTSYCLSTLAGVSANIASFLHLFTAQLKMFIYNFSLVLISVYDRKILI